MKNSEFALWDYLKNAIYSEFNRRIFYERNLGSRSPDFSCWNAQNQAIAFWEVADFEITQSDRAYVNETFEHYLRGEVYVSSGPTREMSRLAFKIRKKSKQFAESGELPGMLVIPGESGHLLFTESDISVAMFGWPGTRISLPRGNPQSFVRTSPGKMNAPDLGDKNSSISAIGLLQYENVFRFKSGLKHSLESAPSDLSISEYFEYYSWAEREARMLGFDLDLKVPILKIYRNCFAKHPWDMNLCGNYDQVYDVFPDHMYPVLVKDGLAPVVRLTPPN